MKQMVFTKDNYVDELAYVLAEINMELAPMGVTLKGFLDYSITLSPSLESRGQMGNMGNALSSFIRAIAPDKAEKQATHTDVKSHTCHCANKESHTIVTEYAEDHSIDVNIDEEPEAHIPETYHNTPSTSDIYKIASTV